MTGEYNGPERRKLQIPEELLEHIAERAAQKALDKVYTNVGKAVLTRLAWVVGAATLALIFILKGGDLKSILKLWADSP